MSTQRSDISWSYSPDSVSLDRRGERSSVPKGFTFHSIGVDGRYQGRYKRFRGMRRIRRIKNPTGPNFSSIQSFEPFSIEKVVRSGSAPNYTYQVYQCTGWLVRGVFPDVSPSYVIGLNFYDTHTSAWVLTLIAKDDNVTPATGYNTVTTAGRLSVATAGKVLYIARDSETLRAFFWDTAMGAFRTITAGPGSPIPREKPLERRQDLRGGVLDNEGAYQVAYRYANKDRNQFTALSEIAEVRFGQVPGIDGAALSVLSSSVTNDVYAGNSFVFGGGDIPAVGLCITDGKVGATGLGPGQKITANGLSITDGVLVQEDASLFIYPPARPTGNKTGRFQIAGPIDTNFTTVQIYRSISVPGVGNNPPEPGGSLYLEHEFDMPRDFFVRDTDIHTRSSSVTWFPPGLTDIDRGSGFWFQWIGDDGEDPGYDPAASDVVLPGIPDALFDPDKAAVGEPPRSGLIHIFEDMAFMPGEVTVEGSQSADLRFTPPDRRELENFPDSPDNRQTLESAVDRVVGMWSGSGILVAWSTNGYLRIARAGGAISIQKALEGVGVTNQKGAVPYGGRILAVTSRAAAMILQSVSGSAPDISIINDILLEEWIADLDRVQCCYDGRLGAVFLFNPVRKKALVIWTNSNDVTELEDMNFVACGQGPHPRGEVSGVIAQFVTNEGLVVYPDSGKLNNKSTMMGLLDITSSATPTQITVNGNVVTALTDSPVLPVLPRIVGFGDSSAKFPTGSGPDQEQDVNINLAECICWLIPPDADGIFIRAEIASNNATQVQFKYPLPDIISASDLQSYTYAISPIPFDVTLSMVGEQDSEGANFRVRNIKGMRLLTDTPRGSGLRNAVFKVGVVRKDAEDFEPGWSLLDFTFDMESQTALVHSTGSSLYPRIQCWQSDLDFGIDNILVIGDLTVNKTMTSTPTVMP